MPTVGDRQSTAREYVHTKKYVEFGVTTTEFGTLNFFIKHVEPGAAVAEFGCLEVYEAYLE